VHGHVIAAHFATVERRNPQGPHGDLRNPNESDEYPDQARASVPQPAEKRDDDDQSSRLIVSRVLLILPSEPVGEPPAYPAVG